jgi:hypothetical protein
MDASQFYIPEIPLPITSPKPEFHFFQSVNIDTIFGQEKGLIIGLEWNLDGDCEQLFDD